MAMLRLYDWTSVAAAVLVSNYVYWCLEGNQRREKRSIILVQKLPARNRISQLTILLITIVTIFL